MRVLANRAYSGDEVLLLVDVANVGFLYLLADDLRVVRAARVKKAECIEDEGIDAIGHDKTDEDFDQAQSAFIVARRDHARRQRP